VRPHPTTDDLAAGAAVVTAAADAAASASAAAVTATLKASAPATRTAPYARSAPSAPRITLVAVSRGSPIDAAKGIAIAAVNPQRGRDLDHRGDFVVPALPIVAVPTTAGTGAETSAAGMVTDPVTHRTFCVGHATSMPTAAILDPALTVGLPPVVTAATGLDARLRALLKAPPSLLARSSLVSPIGAGVLWLAGWGKLVLCRIRRAR
jgi:alcohol dehydrogenase